MKFNVYQGFTLVDTFCSREAASAFISTEYSAAEADMLNVHIEEKEDDPLGSIV